MSQKEISAQFHVSQAKTGYWFLGLTHALGFIAILVSSLALMPQILLSLFVGLSLCLHWRKAQHALPLQLNFHSATGWSVLAAQQLEAIQILPSTLLTGGMIIIHYRSGAKPSLQTRVCFRDSMPDNEFKKLTVMLKLHALAANPLLD